jgi:hypothetical protein
MTTTSANNNIAAEYGKPAAISMGLPTVAGAVPSDLAGHLQQGPALQSEYGRLPRPGEREPISGLARSTLLELNESLPINERFIIRIRRRGKARGSTLIVADRLRAVLAREVAQQFGGGMEGGRL